MPEFTKKALITDYTWPSIDPEEKILEAAGIEVVAAPDSSEETLRSLAVDVDAIMFCFAQVPASVLRAAEKCVVASRFGIGVDNIDQAVCTELGIVVTNIPDYSLEEVADHVMANILAFNRHLIPLNESVRATGWGTAGLPMHTRRLSTTTLGIVGMGRIGRTLTTRALAFGMRVLASDPLLTEENRPDGVEIATFERLLAESDFVSLHTPLIPETTGLIDRDALAAMKPTAFLINTTRGPVIDQEALYDALKSGEIAGAALDVVVPEPLPADHPLLTLDNCLVMPHVASATNDTRLKMAMMCVDNVLAGVAGKWPPFCVNRSAIEGRSRLEGKA